MAKSRLFPTSVAADSANFSATGAATKPDVIDDPYGAPDDDSTYLSVGGVTDRIRFVAQNLAAGIDTINFVEVVSRTRRVSGGNGDAKLYLRAGTGTDYESPFLGVGIEPTLTYIEYRYLLGKSPVTSQPWTVAEVNSIEPGFVQQSLDLAVRHTQLYVEVDHPAIPLGRGTAQIIGAKRIHLRRVPLQPFHGAFSGLLQADLELLEAESWTHEAISTVKDEGAGIEKTTRRLAARLETVINLDEQEMVTTITDMSLRHFLVSLWRTWHTDEAPSAQYQGTASLDSGVLETYVRAGDAWIENPAAAKSGARSLVKLTGDVQRLAPAGLLIEPARTNLLLNPAFSATGGSPFTSWTTTGVTADATDVITESGDSAQSAKMTRSGVGNNRAEQAISLTASTAYYFSAYHKDDSGAKLQLIVFRASDGFFWAGGSTWQAGSFASDLTVRASPDRDYVGPIIKDGSTGNVTFRIVGETTSGQINHLYQVQVEAGRSATSPLLTTTARAKDDLKIENFSGKRVLDTARGDGDLVYVPNANSADLAGGTVLTMFDAYFDASNYMRLQYDVTSGAFQLIGRVAGNSFTASKTQALVRGTAYVLGIRWTGTNAEEGLAAYTISLFVNGVKGTDATPGAAPTMTASPYLYVGQDQAGTNQADGALRYFKIRPFVLGDDEHVDYP